MKTTNLMKSLIMGAMMLGGSSLHATQYCETPLTSGDHTIYLSCQKFSEGNYQILIEGESLTGLGGSYVNANGEAGYYLNGDHMVVAEDGTSITCNITSTTDPSFYTPLYVIFGEGVGQITYTAPADIEWGTCDDVVADTEAPVMGTATLSDTPTHNSAQIQVSGATDNVAVTAYHVVDAANAYDQVLVPTDGILTLSGLKSGTLYNLTVTARDAYGNESINNATVSLQTSTLIYHNFATGQNGNAEWGDPNGRILLTIQKESETSISVVVYPNNEGTVIDFVSVIVNSVSKDLGTAGSGESIAGQKITFTDLTSLNDLKVNILWRTTSMDLAGRWTTSEFTANESELYVEETGPSTLLQTAEATCSVYPNPIVDMLNVNSEMQIAKAVLYNMMGQELMTVAPNAASVQLDCTTLPQGSYMLNVVYVNGQKAAFKVVK